MLWAQSFPHQLTLKSWTYDVPWQQQFNPATVFPTSICLNSASSKCPDSENIVSLRNEEKKKQSLLLVFFWGWCEQRTQVSQRSLSLSLSVLFKEKFPLLSGLGVVLDTNFSECVRLHLSPKPSGDRRSKQALVSSALLWERSLTCSSLALGFLHRTHATCMAASPLFPCGLSLTPQPSPLEDPSHSKFSLELYRALSSSWFTSLCAWVHLYILSFFVFLIVSTSQ